MKYILYKTQRLRRNSGELEDKPALLTWSDPEIKHSEAMAAYQISISNVISAGMFMISGAHMVVNRGSTSLEIETVFNCAADKEIIQEIMGQS